MRVWNDEEIAPNAGFALQVHSNIEIIIYRRGHGRCLQEMAGGDNICVRRKSCQKF
jgi:hypothetical protein